MSQIHIPTTRQILLAFARGIGIEGVPRALHGRKPLLVVKRSFDRRLQQSVRQSYSMVIRPSARTALETIIGRIAEAFPELNSAALLERLTRVAEDLDAFACPPRLPKAYDQHWIWDAQRIRPGNRVARSGNTAM